MRTRYYIATSQAEQGMQELDGCTASKKWQMIAYEGLAPLQKAYLAAIDSLTNGSACGKLQKGLEEAGAVLKQLLELEKKAQYCYIDAQLSILELILVEVRFEAFFQDVFADKEYHLVQEGSALSVAYSIK